jgi:NADH:ubiquinone oxidoreductase subunit 5 (subunit L)/multisubunit Na+/H+ antiporter MnhA subunit
MNRIADVYFILAILFFIIYFFSVDYFFIFNSLSIINKSSIFFIFSFIELKELICFFLFIGVIGKSAQLGLHT